MRPRSQRLTLPGWSQAGRLPPVASSGGASARRRGAVWRESSQVYSYLHCFLLSVSQPSTGSRVFTEVLFLLSCPSAKGEQQEPISSENLALPHGLNATISGSRSACATGVMLLVLHKTLLVEIADFQAAEETRADAKGSARLCPDFPFCHRVRGEVTRNGIQRMAKADLSQKSTDFVALRWHDVSQAWIGIRDNSLTASTTCSLLSMWGDSARGSTEWLSRPVTRPLVAVRQER